MVPPTASSTLVHDSKLIHAHVSEDNSVDVVDNVSEGDIDNC